MSTSSWLNAAISSPITASRKTPRGCPSGQCSTSSRCRSKGVIAGRHSEAEASAASILPDRWGYEFRALGLQPPLNDLTRFWLKTAASIQGEARWFHQNNLSGREATGDMCHPAANIGAIFLQLVAAQFPR